MPGRIGKYTLLKTLGKGASCKVKLALDEDTGRKYAVKIINDNMDQSLKQLVMTEVKAMNDLQHKNIIQQVEYADAEYVKDNGKSKTVSYIVLELAFGGELFDYIANSGRFEERVARYYMKEMLDGLNYCHNQGIVHRDLKPENILLDGQFNLKIADFGFAAPVEGKDGKGNLTTKLGTLNYMAPEIHLKQPYQGRQTDLFAAAIILFIMVAGHPPFTTAEPNDPYYRCIAASRADIFWKTHCKNKPEGDKYFSEEFKSIVQAMLQLDSCHRPSCLEVMAHPWMQGDTATKEEIMQEFQERDIKVKAQIEEERQQKLAQKQAAIQNKIDAYRSDKGAQKEEELTFEEIRKRIMTPSKHIEKYERHFNQNTEFFSTYCPDMIEEEIIKRLREINVEPSKISKNKYKIECTLKSEYTINVHKDGKEVPENRVENVDIVINILNVDENTSCVEFKRLNGDKQKFIDSYKEFKDQIFGHMNDTLVA